jgi:hypothetical protein
MMLWVWVLPAALFLLEFFVEGLSSVLGNFVGCGPAEGCFEQFLYTLPLFTSLAYSFGAMLAKRRGSSQIATSEQNPED